MSNADTNDLRKEYRKILNAFWVGASVEPKEVNAMARAKLPTNPTPDMWITVARSLEVGCGRCAQTGSYQKGKGGMCYRCEGKGYQDLTDAKRNYTYDILALNSI